MAGVWAAGSAAGWALNGWVRSQIYPGGVIATGDAVSDRLTSLDGLGWTLALAAGKIWYLIVSTWGVAGGGPAALLVLPVRRGPPRATPGAARLTLSARAGLSPSPPPPAAPAGTG